MALSVQLGLLESAGLIGLAAIQPELEYQFRHVLVKDAAYHSLVKGDRRALHRAVGETLETLFATPDPEQIPHQLYPLLGLHFAEAGNAARAQRYFTLAGQAAASAYANLEAAAHYAHALAAAGQANAPASDWIDLHTCLGRVYELSGNFEAALKTYAELEALGGRRGDQNMVLAALTLQAVVRAVPSAGVSPVQADSLTTRALALARELADPAGEARALWVRMLYEMLVGHAQRAVAAGEAALALARELGHGEQYALILTDIGRAYSGTGQFQQSRAVLEEARALWRTLNNQPMLAESLNNSAAVGLYLGESEQALPFTEEAYAVSRAAGNAWGQAYALMLRSGIFLELGALQQALDTITACLALASEGGFAAPLVEMRAQLAFLLAYLGDYDRASSEVESALRALEGQLTFLTDSIRTMQAYIHMLAGQTETAQALLAAARVQPGPVDLSSFTPLLAALADAGMGLARGDYAHAVAATTRLLAVERELGIYTLRSDLLLAEARGLMGLGQLDEAAGVLAEARALAEDRHLVRLYWELLAEQSELARRRGQAELAAQLQRQAAGALEALAAQLADPTLRASFLGLPRAQAVLAAGAAGPDQVA